MAEIVVGGIYNGPGSNISIAGNSPQTLNMTDTAQFLAGFSIKELVVWVNDISAPGASVRYNLYDVSVEPHAKLFEVEFVVPEGHTTSGYISMPINQALPGASGGELLAIGRTSKIGPGTFSTKADVGSSSVAASGTTGPDTWQETGTTTEIYDARFVLTDEASGSDNTGLRIKLKDRIGATPPDESGFSVAVRTSISTPDTLFKTTDASIVDGYLTVNSPSIGSVGDTVYVTVQKLDADINLDKNASGRAVVVDLTTGDVS
jgi:hypothetical protein